MVLQRHGGHGVRQAMQDMRAHSKIQTRQRQETQDCFKATANREIQTRSSA